MKQPFLLFAIIAGSALVVSCGNGAETDAKKIADSTNAANIDSAKAKDTSDTHPVAMADMKQDADFASAAADGGMLEVALGKLAAKQATSPAVKKFAAQMIADHTKANLQLKALALSKNITLPDSISDKSKKDMADLQEKKGTDFNKAYTDFMVKDHKDVIDLFKKEVDKGTDSAVVGWARKTIPDLEHHLMMIEDIQKKQ